MRHPFDKMDPHWQGSSVDQANKQKAHYKNGEALAKPRSVPVGKGGNGKVISRLGESTLAQKGA